MIKIEEFKKLNQLSRIEFLLRRKKIEEDTNSNFGLGLMSYFFGVLAFTILAFLGTAGISGIEKATPILNLISFPIVPIFALLIVIGSGIDIFNGINRYKLNKELDNEFFKFKTEVKK